jgi:peptidoglycan/LPS O-acetylase OafA/YrhL
VKDFFRLSLLNNQYPALHGMRVLAIISVLQFHVTVALVEGGVLKDLQFAMRSMTVFFGMDLFFVMSGFLIGTMLLYAIDKKKNQGVWRFWVRRGFRTFPLYWIVLTFLVLAFPLTEAQKKNLFYEYVYLTNYRLVLKPTVVMMWGWSLCVEEHFYLAVPILLGALYLLRSHGARIALLVILWVLGLALRLRVFYASPVPWNDATIFQALYIPTHVRFDILVAGVLLAYVHRYYEEWLDTLLSKPLWRAVFFLEGFVCFAMLCVPHSFPNFFLFRVFSWGTLTSLMYVPWILLLLHAHGPIARGLGHPIFLRFATLGYGIYLIHIPICEKLLVPLAQKLQASFGMTALSLWPLTLALLFFGSAAVAYVLHLVVEKPALWLRDRLAP